MTRWPTRLANVQLFLSGAGIVLMMVNISLDVLGTGLFGVGVPVTIELVTYYYMIMAVFLPLAAVEAKREYLIVDLFMDRAPEGLRRCSEMLRALATAAVFALLSWLTLMSALKSYRTGELVLSALTVHVWPARFILPAAFAAAALVAAGDLLALVRQPGRREQEP
ncbi:TRAP transporter small permease [Arenibaculum sp.]|uniref:TRAP transporter small permease n=1 Tax=Arenibaculum sp. TaxID=2865862 RepID=UPI002E0F395E|nr:TRAP transporter small permease subunit [Arenibaculum sp.]